MNLEEITAWVKEEYKIEPVKEPEGPQISLKMLLAAIPATAALWIIIIYVWFALGG